MKVWKFNDNVDSDQMIPGPYLSCNDPLELAMNLFKFARPGFADMLQPGDIIVAGKNFGCGSSREHPVQGLIGAGVRYVLAESFARTFFRNSINLGLPILTVEGIGEVMDGADLLIDQEGGIIKDLSTGCEYRYKAMPDFVNKIIADGGIVPHNQKLYKEHK